MNVWFWINRKRNLIDTTATINEPINPTASKEYSLGVKEKSEHGASALPLKLRNKNSAINKPKAFFIRVTKIFQANPRQ